MPFQTEWYQGLLENRFQAFFFGITKILSPRMISHAWNTGRSLKINTYLY